jgi:hypothetical protein
MSNYLNLKGTTSLAEYLRQTEIREHTIEYLVALGYAALIVGVEGRQAILAEMTERRARAWEMILDSSDDEPLPFDAGSDYVTAANLGDTSCTTF